MFSVDAKMNIRMHRGDTGAFFVGAERGTGAAWTEDDRMQLTVVSPTGEIVMQRFYRLDDQWDVGDGICLIEFHNSDTDTWPSGIYSTELRFDISPVWELDPGASIPTSRCVNALTAGARLTEGSVVRTEIHASLEILGVYGHI